VCWYDKPENEAFWRNRATAAEQRVESLEAALRWIPVSERLPEVAVSVLTTNGLYVRSSYRDRKGIWSGWKPNAVTYWRPMPEPPAALSVSKTGEQK
jgi:hypothetical protein